MTYNIFEAVIAITAAVVAGSVAQSYRLRTSKNTNSRKRGNLTPHPVSCRGPKFMRRIPANKATVAYEYVDCSWAGRPASTALSPVAEVHKPRFIGFVI